MAQASAERNARDMLEQVRELIRSGHSSRAATACRALADVRRELSAQEAVDLLERACCMADASVVEAVWQAFSGDFAYSGWALALALRCAREDVARLLLSRGVDLLGGVRHPRAIRSLLPHEGVFTRFDLVRESPTLFVNNMDPTVSTEVFEPFTGREQLAGPPYAPEVDLAASCGLVARLAEEGLFDATVFDDLLRASAVKAWKALRHADRRDEDVAGTCLGLAQRLLELHRERGMGDSNIEHVLGNLIVPRADPAIVAFVCKTEPQVFLGRLVALGWLREDGELLRSMVPLLSAGSEEQNRAVLVCCARNSFLDELGLLESWPRTMTERNLREAIRAASEAGRAEAVAWLLARLKGVGDAAALRPAAARQALGDDVGPNPSRRVKGLASSQPSHIVSTPSGPLPDAGEDDGAQGERDALALEVVSLARDALLAQNPFLASSMGLLELAPRELGGTSLSTDGGTLWYDPTRILDEFRATHEPPVHEIAHLFVHCLLLHPFVDASVDARSWDLAADIVAEGLSTELVGPREGERGKKIAAVMEQLHDAFEGRVTTERLYGRLRRDCWDNMREVWEELFRVDDHAPWHPRAADQPTDEGDGADAQDGPSDGQADSQRRRSSQGQDQGSAGSDGHGSGGDYRDGIWDEDEGDVKGEGPSEAEGPAHGSPRPQQAPARDPAAESARREEEWREAAKSIRVDLQTLSRQSGQRVGGLVGELEVSSHERVDYREFLRQFAVQNEEMRLSQDEFDYVFYTYGLELYGDTPLVEPLEFRDERRIRDFALVIDTSSSVTREVVQQFVDASFDVLSSESSWAARTNIHIIQADLRVQSDVRISSVADLDRWRRDIKLRGFGGTDFRPAFRYVNDLLANGEFDDLQGLIYFTDGWGIYPDRMPPYKTTFVFYDEDHRPELVPPWALQITLHPGEFESLSIY